MTRPLQLRALKMARRASAVACVLLVLFIGFVAAVHSHPDSSDSADRACSVCALAHAGVVPAAISVPAPIFARSAVHAIKAVSLQSLLVVSSLYIRPPPVV